MEPEDKFYLQTQDSTMGFMFPCLIQTFFKAFWRRNMQYHDPHIEMCAFYKHDFNFFCNLDGQIR